MDPHYLERVDLIAYISAQGTHITKKEILMAYISNFNTSFEIKLLKKEIFDGPTMDFYGLHKQSKNHFGIKLLKRKEGPTFPMTKQVWMLLWVH